MLKMKEIVNSLDHVNLIAMFMLISRRILGTHELSPTQKRKAHNAMQDYLEAIAEGAGRGVTQGLKGDK